MKFAPHPYTGPQRRNPPLIDGGSAEAKRQTERDKRREAWLKGEPFTPLDQ